MGPESSIQQAWFSQLATVHSYLSSRITEQQHEKESPSSTHPGKATSREGSLMGSSHSSSSSSSSTNSTPSTSGSGSTRLQHSYDDPDSPAAKHRFSRSSGRSDGGSETASAIPHWPVPLYAVILSCRAPFRTILLKVATAMVRKRLSLSLSLSLSPPDFSILNVKNSSNITRSY